MYIYRNDSANMLRPICIVFEKTGNSYTLRKFNEFATLEDRKDVFHGINSKEGGYAVYNPISIQSKKEDEKKEAHNLVNVNLGKNKEDENSEYDKLNNKKK